MPVDAERPAVILLEDLPLGETIGKDFLANFKFMASANKDNLPISFSVSFSVLIVVSSTSSDLPYSSDRLNSSKGLA